MKRFFFLPTSVAWGLFLLLIYSWAKLSFGHALLISVIVFVTGLVTRRSSVPYRDTLKNDGEIYLSPVFGEVKSIRRNVALPHLSGEGQEVRLSISGFSEKGLYLPTAGEATYLRATKGLKISRDAEPVSFYRSMDDVAHTDMVLTSKNKTQTLMRFVDCKYGTRPTIWLKSGDRGRGAACFGYYPFGGTLLIYLPNNSDILIFEKEFVVPGQTVIAALKDTK
jgi:hypothetical protein